MTNKRTVTVPRGLDLTCKNWQLEAAYRMIHHNLDPENADKPVGVAKTHTTAPRVVIANSNLVPNWANWEHFRELDKQGLMMYGQMTAGSWIYIGTQGIVQGTYETFAECARQHFGGTLAGRFI